MPILRKKVIENERKTKKTLNTCDYLVESFVVSEKVANFAPCLE